MEEKIGKWKIVESTENFKTARYNSKFRSTTDLEELEFCEDMLKLGFEPIYFGGNGTIIVFKRKRIK
ncbi:MAG: hypothetical protein WC346_04555 [Methanogenium sp.]|jgi:hypothetical protein